IQLAAVVPAAALPTTTTTAPAPPPPPAPPRQRASRGATQARYAGPIDDDTFIRLSWCEAGGNPTRVSRNGKHFGAWQLSLATWRSMGMAGNPIDYDYQTQLHVAEALYARSGWGQWPVCSRQLGLR